MMPPPDFVALARQVAARHELDPALVCAVCEQESGWNPWAIRYEPGFFSKYVSPQLRTLTPLSATEASARATSWGLMQVMGQVAREHGFSGHYLSQLCQPEIGLDVGCTVLAAKLAVAGGNITAALLLWNGGASQAYPSEVLSRLPVYQK